MQQKIHELMTQISFHFSLSLSEEDLCYDSLSIKPPQPQADYTASEERTKKFKEHSSSQHRNLSYKSSTKTSRRTQASSKEEKKESRKVDGRERFELKNDDRHFKESRKEDLRERLERERKSRRSKDHESRYDVADSKRQHEVKKIKKTERIQAIFEPSEVERSKNDSKPHDPSRDKRKKLSVDDAVNYYQEDDDLEPESSKVRKTEDNLQFSKTLAEECSDEGIDGNVLIPKCI